MVGQLRKLLRNHYIGAITIGYLIGRGVEDFVRGVLPFFTAVLAKIIHRVEVPSEYWTTNIPSSFINGVLGSILFVAAAFGIARWVYPDLLKRTDVAVVREGRSEQVSDN